MSDSLFFISSANIFSIYPTVFKEIFDAEDEKRKNDGPLKKDFVYLPSDFEWQDKIYYRLLEEQKQLGIAEESGEIQEVQSKKICKILWDPTQLSEDRSSTSTTPSSFTKIKGRCIPDLPIKYIDIKTLGDWSLENIAKAGKLLKKPPIEVEFEDEHEMRKVYSLIYDVFRHKHILNQALNDVSFFIQYPEVKHHKNRVWLLLFELHTRHFIKRNAEEHQLQEILYKESDLTDISLKIWKHRVKLAASISRLRIKKGALYLSELLPLHLQNEKVAIAAANPIVTGWINPFKIKDKILASNLLEKMGLIEVNQQDTIEEKPLLSNQYKWDKVCPLFLSCLPSDRSEFAKSDLVKSNCFILQDRTFSIAPAILSRLLDHFDIEGDIIQTHVSSPRSTAYLAALFYSINRVNNFLAFGAGSKTTEYCEYIKLLDVNNVKIFSENFCTLSLESNALESVVGIFATPPNSFSGIADPIDLICSRGGDLSMLEILTESEMSDEGRLRVNKILEEQKETLRVSMSRPQVQFILYETHSIVEAENQDMVEKSVEQINHNAFEKHLVAYKEKKRLEALAEAETSGIPSAAFSSPRKRDRDSAKKKGKISRTNSTESLSKKSKQDGGEEDSTETSDAKGPEDYSKVVKVPKTDEFLISNLPDVCANRDKCLDFNILGCYISLIHRKQITKLDAKQLIRMAEAKGLFGNADRKKSAKKTTKKAEKRTEKRKVDPDKQKIKKTDIDSLIQRINQPTHASFIRSTLPLIDHSLNFATRHCLRHIKYNVEEYPCATIDDLNERARKWWRESAKYIKELQNNIKKLPFVKGNPYEIAHLLKNTKAPPFKLTRINIKCSSPSLECEFSSPIKHIRKIDNPKRPYPVAIRQLELDYHDILRGQEKLNTYYEYSGYWTV
ncbi:uncharacterized protein LOC129613998 [Condylostylus longicornis]|uniref:uncharacterized protein LOC129613998 n=1 Tax=Condylostylus longicornis TaxID=2530218 RepID=UPI00244E39D2|nr:uncharacterized protein LOC129613998 [Condylostylus longicornis]